MRRHLLAPLVLVLTSQGTGAWADDAGVVPVEAAPQNHPDAPTVSARVSHDVVAVGDVVTLTITSIAPGKVAINLPTQLSLQPFELIGRTQSETDLGDGRMRREFVLQIAGFEPGEHTVPSVPLTYLGGGGAVRTAHSPAVKLRIKSLIANEPEPALKPDSAPVRVYEDRLWPAYLLGGLMAAGAGLLLGFWLRRRWRDRKIVRPLPPPRPAHEIAFEKLDRLGASLQPDMDLRPFYFELSETLREYLGNRFGFDSLELTTDELMAELQRRPHRSLLTGQLHGWLSACDLVKFAKIAPTESEARGALETAIQIVTATRARPEPVAPAPAQSNEDVRHA